MSLNSKKINLVVLFAVFGFPIFAAANGLVQSTPSSTISNTSDSWQFSFTPYVWAPGIDGSVKIGYLPTESVDASANDLLKELNLGLMGEVEVRKGLWGFVADAFYVDLRNTLSSQMFGNANSDVTEQFYTLAGMYRPVDDKISIDLVGGARYMNLDADLNIPAIERKFSDNSGWWDGFAGVRAIYNITNRWLVVGYADIGTGGSKISWQVLAGVDYAFSHNFVGKIGYRIISEDYDKDKFILQYAYGWTISWVRY